jgi:glycosyltransferase involved in cell wall biosynthesis
MIAAQHDTHSKSGEPRKASAVSVVVPCYNGGRFIDQLLGSLAQQTFRDFDIVIVNDGSTEQATLDKLARLDPAIRVVHQDNQGLAGARNAGIAAASSDLVLLIDCDDIIEPAYLAETVPLLRAAPDNVAIAFTHIRRAGAAKGIARRYFNPFDVLFTNTVSACMVLRKSAWQAVGGFDAGMRDGYEDWEFSIKLARAGYRGIEVPKPLFVYQVSADGMLLNKATRMHGALWRYIRRKHPDVYRLPAMLRVWWASRHDKGEISLAKGLAAYALAVLLPDALFSQLVGRLRNRRMTGQSVNSSMTSVAPAGSNR